MKKKSWNNKFPLFSKNNQKIFISMSHQKKILWTKILHASLKNTIINKEMPHPLPHLVKHFKLKHLIPQFARFTQRSFLSNNYTQHTIQINNIMKSLSYAKGKKKCYLVCCRMKRKSCNYFYLYLPLFTVLKMVNGIC